MLKNNNVSYLNYKIDIRNLIFLKNKISESFQKVKHGRIDKIFEVNVHSVSNFGVQG